MEVRQERVDATKLEAGDDEEVGAPLERCAARQRLEHARRRRPDRQHPLRGPDPSPGLRLDAVPLAVDRVLLDRLGRQRPERVEPDVERDPLVVEAREQLGREVEPCRRGGGRARLVGVDRLVALRVVRLLVDVGRKRQLAGRFPVEAHPPPPPAEVLEELDGLARRHRVTRRQPLADA